MLAGPDSLFLWTARELAHEMLQPYMALDSKLGSIFREPTLLVDVQLIDAVLSEIPEASLPPELRFAHTHYYQRAPHAGYGTPCFLCVSLAVGRWSCSCAVMVAGRNGWHPQPWSYQHQRYEHQPGPFVPSLLPQLPCQRYDPLWDPERRLKCAFYPTRSYPSPALYGGADSRVDLNAWPVLAPTVDHLRIPYYRPFAFLSMPYGGGGYRGGRGGGRGGRGGRGGLHVVGVPPLEATIVESAPTDADAGGAPPPAGGFAPRPGRGGRGNRGGRGFARGGRGGAHAQHPQQHLPAEAAAAALVAPAELGNGGDADPAAVAAEGPHRGGRGGRRGGRGGRRGGRGGRRAGESDGGDAGQPNPQHGDASAAAPHQPRATRGRARAPPVYKPKPSAGGPSPGAVVAVVPTTSGPQP